MKHLSLNLAIVFFFAGIGSAICTAVHHSLGGLNQLFGTQIPLIVIVPMGLVIFMLLQKFVMNPLYRDYCGKISGMKKNNILSAVQEQKLLSHAGIYRKSYCLWVFATSWLVIPVVCYCISFWFLRLWIDKMQTPYE